MTENGPGVSIGLREIYDGVQQANRNVETVQKDVKTLAAATTEVTADHTKRIRSLELRFYGILAGLIGALTAIGFRAFGG